MNKNLSALLGEHNFLLGLPPAHLEVITGCASNVKFDAGETLFREGDEAHQFYLVRHGRVALDIFAPGRGPITIQTVGEGEVVGWSWLVAPYHWRFTARAVELTRAVALDGRCLREKCERDHSLAYELLKRLADVVSQRLDATRLQLLDVYAATAPTGKR
ncbi:MAG TPA: cyclic nucleotide-binding domain-containing protein [Candidatus Saccharimonadales bacterium]|nr:cyclic nucleotide-binding domain-containing protein [Candidatus Saccharimonadales bacterium]